MIIKNPYELATRYVGIRELAGATKDHPLIRWWLSLCGFGFDVHDETPWCSAFLNGMAWEMRLPRSKSAAARSWLTIGTPIRLDQARRGFDVVIFTRLNATKDPRVLNAPGHVALFGGIESDGDVLCLSGNQDDGVCVKAYSASDLIGVRSLGA